MHVYHRTWAAEATAILTGGFQNGERGFVWLSDVPLEGDDIKGGEGGDVCLMLEVSGEIIAKSEVKQWPTHKAYQVPAEDIAECEISLALTDYAGMTRDDLLTLMKTREAEEADGRELPTEGSRWSTSRSYRDALAFLDRFAPLP